MSPQGSKTADIDFPFSDQNPKCIVSRQVHFFALIFRSFCARRRCCGAFPLSKTCVPYSIGGAESEFDLTLQSEISGLKSFQKYPLLERRNISQAEHTSKKCRIFEKLNCSDRWRKRCFRAQTSPKSFFSLFLGAEQE